MHIKKMIKSLVYVTNKHRNIITEDITRIESDAAFLSMSHHTKFRPLVTEYIIKDQSDVEFPLIYFLSLEV